MVELFSDPWSWLYCSSSFLSGLTGLEAGVIAKAILLLAGYPAGKAAKATAFGTLGLVRRGVSAAARRINPPKTYSEAFEALKAQLAGPCQLRGSSVIKGGTQYPVTLLECEAVEVVLPAGAMVPMEAWPKRGNSGEVLSLLTDDERELAAELVRGRAAAINKERDDARRQEAVRALRG